MNLKVILIVIIGFCISNTSRAQNYNDIEFSIIFGDNFNHDTLSLFINDSEYIKSEILSSDFSDGVTGVSLCQDKRKCIINLRSNKIFLDRIPIEDSLKIKVTIRGHEKYTNNFYLKNGKVIVFNYSITENVEGKILKSLKYLQYKHNVQFD